MELEEKTNKYFNEDHIKNIRENLVEQNRRNVKRKWVKTIIPLKLKNTC